MKIVNLLFVTICSLLLGASHYQPIKQCVNSYPSDTDNFGSALAVNDKYLVVGDPYSNQLVVYTRDRDGKWLRTREVLPPEDSTAYKVGSGFGQGIHVVVASIFKTGLLTCHT